MICTTRQNTKHRKIILIIKHIKVERARSIHYLFFPLHAKVVQICIFAPKLYICEKLVSFHISFVLSKIISVRKLHVNVQLFNTLLKQSNCFVLFS